MHGDYIEGTKSSAIDGGPCLCHSWNVKHVSLGPQGFANDDKGDLGELARYHDGWFSDGIRFLSPRYHP